MFEKVGLGGKKFYGFGCSGPDTEFFNTIGGLRPFAALCTDVSDADKTVFPFSPFAQAEGFRVRSTSVAAMQLMLPMRPFNLAL